MNAEPTGSAPDTGIPPWEITDSFLAIRTESPGPARGTGRPPAVPGASEVPPEFTGSPRDDTSFPADTPSNSGFPGSGGPSSANQGETTDFLSGIVSFPTRPAEPPGFPRDGSSPTSPGEPSGFPRGGEPFPASGEAPSLFRRPASFPTAAEPSGSAGGGASFPATPAEPPGFRRGGSFPGTPAGASGSPSARPGDASESTESFSVLPPNGDGQLPRRIPLSERGGTYPPPTPRADNDAYRLFPFGKNTDLPPGKNDD